MNYPFALLHHHFDTIRRAPGQMALMGIGRSKGKNRDQATANFRDVRGGTAGVNQSQQKKIWPGLVCKPLFRLRHLTQ